MPQPTPYAGWLHAFVMQYQVLPSFMFGFLLTTFPRWMGLPDFPRWRYMPVGLGMFGGQVATLLGAIGWEVGIVVGFWMTLAGWIAGLATLGPLLWREQGTTWHARSCFAALSLGLLGLLAWGALLSGGPAMWAFVNIKIGTFGLLLPVYATVAHRMFPFFASNVVAGYKPWRPLWLLAAFWPLCLAHLVLELLHAYGWLWLVDVPLLALTATMLWHQTGGKSPTAKSPRSANSPCWNPSRSTCSPNAGASMTIATRHITLSPAISGSWPRSPWAIAATACRSPRSSRKAMSA